MGSDICSHLIEKLHGTRFSGKKIYCNGIIPTTPEKVKDKKIAPTKYVTRTVSSGASESETSDTGTIKRSEVNLISDGT